MLLFLLYDLLSNIMIENTIIQRMLRYLIYNNNIKIKNIYNNIQIKNINNNNIQIKNIFNNIQIKNI